MALEVKLTLQTKCKTCFRGPRMVLHAHFKKTHYCTWGLVIDVHFGTPPPVWQKTTLFPDFFLLLPSLSIAKRRSIKSPYRDIHTIQPSIYPTYSSEVYTLEMENHFSIAKVQWYKIYLSIFQKELLQKKKKTKKEDKDNDKKRIKNGDPV